MNPKPFFEGEGGSYLKWLPSDYPLLAQTNVAGGRLLLRPRGFAVPHYADCSKFGYVLQGTLSLLIDSFDEYLNFLYISNKGFFIRYI